MLKRFNHFMSFSLIFSTVLILIGLVLIIVPEISLSIISNTIAIVLLLYGFFLIVLDTKSLKNIIIIDSITSGILFVILGIIILIYPKIVSTVFPVCLGLWFIISSIYKVRISLLLTQNTINRELTLILSILSVICGAVLITNPIKSAEIITSVLGVIILVYSISDFTDILVFKKNINSIVKSIKKKYKQVD